MPTSSQLPHHGRALLMLVLATLFWGLSFPVIKAIVAVHGRLLPDSGTWFVTASVLAPRFLLSALVLGVFCWRSLATLTREVAMSRLGLLCNKPPWGTAVAVDLKAGRILWRSSVGTTEDRAPLGLAFNWGSPLVNGVAITAGGLLFTGAMDAYLRAFDAKSGEELWQGRLPVPGVANPMTYLWKGEQYVVIAAGGHSEAGTSIGDSVVAFRLARAGEAPSLWSRTVDRPGGRFWARAFAFGLACLLTALALWQRRRRARAH